MTRRRLILVLACLAAWIALLGGACGSADPEPAARPATAASPSPDATAPAASPTSAASPADATAMPAVATGELVVSWDPNGGAPRRLTPNGSEIAGSETDPAWSPDGRQVAFMRYYPGPEVAIDNFSTPAPDADATQTAAAYIPAALMVVDADGGEPRALTNLTGFNAPHLAKTSDTYSDHIAGRRARC